MSVEQELRTLARFRPLQLLTLSALLTALGMICFTLKYCVIDLDMWWHLRVGDWIIQHAAFPHTGILSRTAADRPWAAYSWGYEVLLSRAYAWFGLVGVGVYGTVLTLAVAFGVYWMLRRLSGRFWFACLLAVACCYGFLLSMMPRPGFFSIALFCIVLTMILEARRNCRVQTLYWLPLIFLFWANLHIQFIYGLCLIALLLGVTVLQDAMTRLLNLNPSFLTPATLPTGRVALIAIACVIATFIGPYSFHLYGIIWAYSHAKLPYSIIIELQPLSFRNNSNYFELLLAAAAFFVVGWQKKIDPFKLLLMVVASVVAFRTMRDAWFLCIPAAACIADSPLTEFEPEPAETGPQLAGVFAAVALALLLFARGVGFTTRGLDLAMSGMFPVNAANFLRQNPAPGPLYNIFDWGGFLTWYMPQYPVAIDGRTDLYGEVLDKQFSDTESGNISYRDDPYLNESRVVLLRKRDGLVPLLQSDSRFQMVYQDAMAVVFIKQ